MLIFFVRHGLTDWNIQRRFQGTCDVPLNEAGLEQAHIAASRCAQLGLERIYHGTLLRAAQTAQAIGDVTGAPLFPSTRFAWARSRRSITSRQRRSIPKPMLSILPTG